MKTVLKMASAFLRQHPVRTLLTVFATASATCLVLWMVSGYEALLQSHDVYAERALGRYTLSVDPISRRWDRRVPPEVVEALRADPSVTAAEPMWAERVVIQSRAVKLQAPPPGSGSQPGEGANECLLLGTDAPAPPFDLVRGRWMAGAADAIAPATDAIDVAVSGAVADRFGVDLGGTLIVGREDAARPLRVVGIVDNPPVPITGRSSASMTLPSPSIAGIYARMRDAATILNQQPAITFVGVSLKPDVDVHAFRYAWAPRLSAFDQPAQFQEDHDLEEQLDETAAADNVRLQAYAATLMAMLLAFLVIFNTLNMGVSERTRQFAMMRAIGLTRAEVAQTVFLESLLIAGVGFAAGLLFGQGLLTLTASLSEAVLRHGAHVGGLGAALAALAAFGAALLAALIPAWRATRVKPLDAMAPPQAAFSHAGRSGWLLLAGLALIAVAPSLTFVFPPSSEHQARVHLALGVFVLGLGFLLLAPGIVRLVDRFAGVLVARAIGLSPKLLAQQLSCHMGRTVASAIALSVGLTLFVSIQVWGYTLLETFVPGEWAPEMQLQFAPDGLSGRDVESVARLPGVDPARCAAIVVEQPRLREDLTGSAEHASVTRQDNVVIVGIDPAKAIGGDAPLLDFTYVQGSREAALEAMQGGRGCIVPEHFLRETGLKVGDRFELVPPENPQHPVAYTVAASADFQGWHWMTKVGGLRVRTHRAAALIVANFDAVRDDFDLFQTEHVWLRYASPTTDPRAVAAEARKFYAGVLGQEVADGRPRAGGPGGGAPGVPEAHGRPVPYVQAVTAAQVRQTIRGMAARWLWAVSVLPLVAVAIGALGVLTVVISSVRARQWEMGVLRALGFSRGTLVRLVVAEGLLVGIVACALSLGFGIMAGWCGTGLSRHISFFGGMEPVLVIPLAALLVGLIVVLLFAALAAAGPAIRVGRTHPLELLQQGRSAL